MSLGYDHAHEYAGMYRIPIFIWHSNALLLLLWHVLDPSMPSLRYFSSSFTFFPLIGWSLLIYLYVYLLVNTGNIMNYMVGSLPICWVIPDYGMGVMKVLLRWLMGMRNEKLIGVCLMRNSLHSHTSCACWVEFLATPWLYTYSHMMCKAFWTVANSAVIVILLEEWLWSYCCFLVF